LRNEWRAPITLGAGIIAALNTGKLPPALGVLRDEFSLSLVQVSWLVSLLLLGSSLLGIAGGSIADRFGHRRVMISGLLILGGAGLTGAFAHDPQVVFISRALESIGFILTVLPGPSLLRRSVSPARLSVWLSGWGTYMPLGTGTALALGPWLIESAGWRPLWITVALLSLVWAWAIARAHPAATPSVVPSATADETRAATAARGSASLAEEPSLTQLAMTTLRAPGPWLLMLCFMFYAAQFLGIFSFLPTIYREAGIDLRTGGALTALGVLINVIGNLSAGRLLERGLPRGQLVIGSAVIMAAMAWLAFGSSVPFWFQYGAVLVLSMVGGLIPGALFASAPVYAPDPRSVSTTVGWMQQGSGIGQLLVPPLIAALAQSNGSWQYTWMITGLCSAVVVLTGLGMRRLDQSLSPPSQRG
jgi:MFS family permease